MNKAFVTFAKDGATNAQDAMALLVQQIKGGKPPAPYRGTATCYIEFGGDRVARFDADFLARFKQCDPSLLDGLEAFAPLGRSEYWGLESSARRWIAAPLFSDLTFMESRKPFVANDIVEFVYSLPDRYRYRGRLYQTMLLGAFPEYYRHIPWANIGIPIGRPRVRAGCTR